MLLRRRLLRLMTVLEHIWLKRQAQSVYVLLQFMYLNMCAYTAVYVCTHSHYNTHTLILIYYTHILYTLPIYPAPYTNIYSLIHSHVTHTNLFPHLSPSPLPLSLPLNPCPLGVQALLLRVLLHRAPPAIRRPPVISQTRAGTYYYYMGKFTNTIP